MQDVQLIVIPHHVQEVDTDCARRKACPSSSEVPTVIVRRRACPSCSEVLTGVARRKGKCAIHLPPKYPRPSLTKPLDLGCGELFSSLPVGVAKTHNHTQQDAEGSDGK